MLNNQNSIKYETPYKGPFLITQCCTNGTVTIQYCATKIRYNIRWIKPYKYDTNVGDITTETFMTMSTYDIQLYSYVLY